MGGIHVCGSDWSGANVIYLVTTSKLRKWYKLQGCKLQFQTLLEGSQTCIWPPSLCQNSPNHSAAAAGNINAPCTAGWYLCWCLQRCGRRRRCPIAELMWHRDLCRFFWEEENMAGKGDKLMPETGVRTKANKQSRCRPYYVQKLCSPERIHYFLIWRICDIHETYKVSLSQEFRTLVSLALGSFMHVWNEILFPDFLGKRAWFFMSEHKKWNVK